MSAPGSEPWVKDGIKKFLKTLDAWFYMPVQNGMGEGGVHDFVACVPVVITQEMVGKRVGMFLSIEAKEFGTIVTLQRQAEKNGKHSHPAKDGKFISNRALQTMQADRIHAADGQAWVADDIAPLAKMYSDWQGNLKKE